MSGARCPGRRRSGGTGRRAGLKIPCPRGREGSSPSSGTTSFPVAWCTTEGVERARIAERSARKSATHRSAEDPSPAAKAGALAGRRLRRASPSSGTISSPSPFPRGLSLSSIQAPSETVRITGMGGTASSCLQSTSSNATDASDSTFLSIFDHGVGPHLRKMARHRDRGLLEEAVGAAVGPAREKAEGRDESGHESNPNPDSLSQQKSDLTGAL